MNIIRELKSWVTQSPKHRAMAALILMILLAVLFRLFRHFEGFLASPVGYWGFMVGMSLLWSYVIYAIGSVQQRAKEVPHLATIPSFSTFAAIIKLVTASVILVSIGLLLFFRIENWGGEPNFREQIRAQVVGLAFLIPIGASYLFCGWIFSNPKYYGWSYNIFVPAFALYLWNANFAWRNPVHPISSGYEAFYSLLRALPFLPIPILLIPLIIWLFMAGLKLKSSSKVA